MDYSLSGSSVHGIFQARKLEWVAISSSRGSSWPRDWTNDSCVSDFGRWTFYHWATWEALYIQTNIWSATVTSECGISGFGVEVSDQGGTFTFYFILVFIFRIVFLAVACPVFLIKKNKDQLKESLTRPDSGLAPLWVLCWLLDAQGRGPGGGFCRTLIMHRIGLQILPPASHLSAHWWYERQLTSLPPKDVPQEGLLRIHNIQKRPKSVTPCTWTTCVIHLSVLTANPASPTPGI